MKTFEILSVIDDHNIIYHLRENGQYSQYNIGSFTLDDCLSFYKNKIHSIKRLSDGEVFTIGDNITHFTGKDKGEIISFEIIYDYILVKFKGNYEGESYYVFQNTHKVIKHYNMKTFEILAYNCTGNDPVIPNQIFEKTNDDKYEWGDVIWSSDHINRYSNAYHIYSIKRISDGLVLTLGDTIRAINHEYIIQKFNVFERNGITNIQIDLKGVEREGYRPHNNTILLTSIHSLMVNNIKFKKEMKKEPKVLFVTEDNIKVFNKKHPQLYWIHKETLEKGKDEANSLDQTYDPNYYYFRYFRNRNNEYKELKQKLKANV